MCVCVGFESGVVAAGCACVCVCMCVYVCVVFGPTFSVGGARVHMENIARARFFS